MSEQVADSYTVDNVTFTVEHRQNDYMAYFNGNKNIWGSGKTPNSAIGDAFVTASTLVGKSPTASTPAPTADAGGFWSELRALVVKYDEDPDKLIPVGTREDIDRAIPIERRYTDALRAIYNMAHHLEGIEAANSCLTAELARANAALAEIERDAPKDTPPMSPELNFAQAYSYWFAGKVARQARNAGSPPQADDGGAKGEA